MLERYINWLQENGKRENTIRRYRSSVAEFLKWYEDTTGQTPFRPELVTTLDIQDYKSHLEKAKIIRGRTPKTLKEIENRKDKQSIRTINNKIEALRSFFNFLIEEDFIQINPVSKIKTKRVANSSQPRWLTRLEKNRLFMVVNDERKKQKNPWKYHRNKAIVFCLYHAGLRVSEVVALEISDLKFDKGFLEIRDGKGGVSRIVEINSDLRKALKEWIDVRGDVDSEKLFTSQKGELTTDGVQYLFSTLRKETGIEDLTPHVLRHTLAHDLIERGFALTIVADILGHTDIKTTRIYTTSSVEERKKALESVSEEK